jgi:anti-sigma B factor antagonist
VAIRSLTVHIDPRPGAVTLAVAGEIDRGAADQLVAPAAAVLAEAPRQPVLDFTDVPYMDSSELSGLIKLHARANETRTRTEIDHPRRLARLFTTTTGLAEVFHVTPTAGEADLT